MVLAARGTRNMDFGDEPVNDRELEGRLRVSARKVYIESVVMALVLTLIMILIPR